MSPFAEIQQAGEALLVLVTLLLKPMLILGAAWGLERVFRRASAAVRHGIWLVALASAAAFPLASPWVPARTVEIPRVLERPRAEVVAPVTLGAGGPAAAAEVLVRSGGEGVVTAPHEATVANVDGTGADRWAWWRVVLIVWLMGAVLRLGWLGLQLVRTRWLASTATPEVDDARARLAEQLASSLGIWRPVCVLESARVSMPLTWGALRPIILLPAEAAEWPEERLRIVLLHELAHIRRCDYLSTLLMEVACALYWPNPMVWMARRRILEQQELACDDRVLQAGTRSIDYAEHLLAIARAFQGSRWEFGPAVTMAREISLKSRIRTLLDDRVSRAPFSFGSALWVVAMIAGVVLPLAAIRPALATADTIDDAPLDPTRTALGVPDSRAGLPSGGPTPPGTSDHASAPAPEAERAFIWLEAESATLTGPFFRALAPDASGGAYIEVQSGFKSERTPPADGTAHFHFALEQAGTYTIWARTLVRDGHDSFWIRANGGPWIRWNSIRRDTTWRWAAVHDSDRSERVVAFELPAGENVVELAYREDEIRLDLLLVTDDPNYQPTGTVTR